MDHRGERPGDGKDAVELAEAANRLGISLATLQTIVEHGFLKAHRDASGRWMVLLEPGEGVSEPLAPPATPQATLPPSSEVTGSNPAAPAATRARDLPPVGDPAAETIKAAAAAEGSQPVGEAETNPAPPTSEEPAASAGSVPPAEPAAIVPPPRAVATSSGVAAPPAVAAPPGVAAPPEGVTAGVVERLLTEQITYLRQQIERREHESLSRDRLVGELAAQLAKLSRRSLERPAESDLREQIERVRREQAEISARHQRALDSLGDLLLSLRNHLAGRQEAQRSVR